MFSPSNGRQQNRISRQGTGGCSGKPMEDDQLLVSYGEDEEKGTASMSVSYWSGSIVLCSVSLNSRKSIKKKMKEDMSAQHNDSTCSTMGL